jgi:hypothetical protein
MARTLYVKQGHQLEFPVPADHELAGNQELRAPTRDEILQNPFYSSVVAQRAAQAKGQVRRESIIDSIIGRIGLGWVFHLPEYDITVQSGGVLSIQGSWNWMQTGNFIIEPGGLVRVYTTDPQVPAFLLLKCSSFGTEIVKGN